MDRVSTCEVELCLMTIIAVIFTEVPPVILTAPHNTVCQARITRMFLNGTRLQDCLAVLLPCCSLR